MNASVISDLKDKDARIKGLDEKIAYTKDVIKDLAAERRLLVKTLNKLVARHPEEAASAEVKAIVKEEAAAET